MVVVFYFFNGLSAQIINFPDVKFKEMLLTSQTFNDVARDLEGKGIKIDSNNNGEIELNEAEKVGALYLTASLASNRITSLVGILNFKNLKKINIEMSLLTTLNLNGLTSLEYLECDNNQQLISISLNGLSNLKTLDLYGCRITSLNLTDLASLETLDCTANPILSLNVNNLFNLKYLKCEYTKITSLNISDLKLLNTLNCSNNPLMSLTLNGLDGLKTINSQYTEMTNLNLSNLLNLEILSVNHGKLKTITTSNLYNLKELGCNFNQITTLNIINSNNLETLGCENNTITELNLGNFNKLKYLNCSNNKISLLNISNLINLEYLICGTNLLTALDIQPLKNLQYLYCHKNEIRSLDLSNLNKIIHLNCSYNQLTSLDLNDLKNLKSLECNDNDLNYLFIKNGISETGALSVYNNPNLKYICADDFDIEFLKNYLKIFNMQIPNINDYCSFVPGGTFYTINTYNKLDLDNNGCDEMDIAYPNVKYNIIGDVNSGTLIADNLGKSSIELQSGTYTITPILENQNYFSISPSEIVVSFPTETSPSVQNFCIVPNGAHADLEIQLLPLEPARPGFDAKYKIICKNKGNVAQSGSINLKFDDRVLDYVSSNTTFSSETIGNREWNFTNLTSFQSKEIIFTVHLNSPISTPAVNNGDILKFVTTITSQGTDETPNDNTFSLNQTVVGSYDPNDKTCLEGSIITPSLIGEYVHYMIRFENTGTYPAQNIVVKDMIDLDKFDISTLIPTNSNHSFVTKISEGNKVEFIFENINLLFDDANNDGYIAFKIKTLPTLKVGDTFANDANIYFDYNFPILTNKATSKFQTTLDTPDFEFSNYFTLYPNPTSDILNINSVQAIEIQSLAIYDVLGQLVIAVPNAKSVSAIDVSRLKSGNYFIKVKSDKGSSNIKFIKK